MNIFDYRIDIFTILQCSCLALLFANYFSRRQEYESRSVLWQMPWYVPFTTLWVCVCVFASFGPQSTLTRCIKQPVQERESSMTRFQPMFVHNLYVYMQHIANNLIVEIIHHFHPHYDIHAPIPNWQMLLHCHFRRLYLPKKMTSPNTYYDLFLHIPTNCPMV